MLADFPIVYLIYYTAFTVHLVAVWDMLHLNLICVLMLFYKLFRVLEATLWCVSFIVPKFDEDMDKLYKMSSKMKHKLDLIMKNVKWHILTFE